MNGKIADNWRDARVADLREWSMQALDELAKELGLYPMDPKQERSLAHAIADKELLVLLEGYPPADVAGVPFEEDEEDIGTVWCKCPILPVKHEARLSCVPGGLAKAEPHWYNKILLDVDPREMKTESADFIVNTILPKFLRHFFAKNADYGDQHRTGLGPKGEFVGLHRKVAKLQKAIWDEEEMVGEQTIEMLYDLIGTALLMLDLLNQPLADPGEPKAY